MSAAAATAPPPAASAARASTQTTTAAVHAVYGTSTPAAGGGAKPAAAAAPAAAAVDGGVAAEAAAHASVSADAPQPGDDQPVTLEWCRNSLPKVELHAHLSGSVRASTLRELLALEAAHLAAVAAGAAAGAGAAAAGAAAASTAFASSGAGAASAPAPAAAAAPAAQPAAPAAAAGAGAASASHSSHSHGPSSSHAVRFAVESKALDSEDRSLDECFKIFAVLHRVVNNGDTLRRVTHEVIDDFAADGVAYLELRTTPRSVPYTHSPFTAHLTKAAPAAATAATDGKTAAAASNPALTKREALQIVLDAMAAAELRHTSKATAVPAITVRLLLSVDRTASVAEAQDTIELARELTREAKRDPTSSARYVVGLDFSGNPMRSTFAHFAAVFESARAPNPLSLAGPTAVSTFARPLRVTVHTAEVDDDNDTRAIIHAFRPERLGHAVFLKADDMQFLRANPIPIEICVTSNCKLMTVNSFDTHPFGALFAQHYPIVLSTDDSGVFGVTLSSEYHGVAAAWGLTRSQVRALARKGVGYTFLDGSASAHDAAALKALHERFR